MSVLFRRETHMIRICLIAEYYVQSSDGVHTQKVPVVLGTEVRLSRKCCVFVGDLTKKLQCYRATSLQYPHKHYHRCSTHCQAMYNHSWSKSRQFVVSSYVASGVKMFHDPTQKVYEQHIKERSKWRAASKQDVQRKVSAEPSQ